MSEEDSSQLTSNRKFKNFGEENLSGKPTYEPLNFDFRGCESFDIGSIFNGDENQKGCS
jgi:hypothetical protein